MRAADVLFFIAFLVAVSAISFGYYEVAKHGMSWCSLSNTKVVEDVAALSDLNNRSLRLAEQNVMLENDISQLELEISRLMKKLNATMIEPSPISRIERRDVQVYSDRILLYVDGAFPVQFSNTGSMSPLINQNVLALEMKPNSPQDLQIGDIIGYESQLFNITIVHRIIDIGEDELGWFAITKGDANDNPDSERVRFSQVEGVIVGLIY